MISKRVVFIFLVLSEACTDPPPRALSMDAPVLTVCEAARSQVGSRIRIKGEFTGFDHATQATTFSLASDGVCTDRGAGLIIATALTRDEMAKLANAQPRGRRPPITPGTIVEIQGDVMKIEDGRFVYVEQVIVK
jgi:hypothetical protein